ncbi:hypothetical protein CEXT_785911 [Caerostris extrusa]|uniref:Uncharacterized protein n=1 Tax=Caerostris extrusa TaxID=172846 RepID=A0AAV4UBA9_CAEEX|nr:hypothetical protein CEXT_785911 [Caerostris extrusa]
MEVPDVSLVPEAFLRIKHPLRDIKKKSEGIASCVWKGVKREYQSEKRKEVNERGKEREKERRRRRRKEQQHRATLTEKVEKIRAVQLSAGFLHLTRTSLPSFPELVAIADNNASAIDKVTSRRKKKKKKKRRTVSTRCFSDRGRKFQSIM